MSQEQVGGPSIEEIQAILMDCADARAASFGRHFGPDSRLSVQALINEAAEEVYSPSRFGLRSEQWSTVDVAERIADARSAVEKVVDVMAAAAAGIADYGPDRLGEDTFAAVMSRNFCPLWPFC